MVSHFDPRTGADRYSRVTHPVSASGLTSTRPRTLQHAVKHDAGMEAGGGGVRGQVRDEDAKVLALKSIMLATLFGDAEVFRGRSFSTYGDLQASITRYF